MLKLRTNNDDFLNENLAFITKPKNKHYTSFTCATVLLILIKQFLFHDSNFRCVNMKQKFYQKKNIIALVYIEKQKFFEKISSSQGEQDSSSSIFEIRKVL